MSRAEIVNPRCSEHRKERTRGIESSSPEARRAVGILLVMAAAIFIVASPGWARIPMASTPNYLPEMYQRWPTPTATPMPGYLLVTEVLYDPPGSEPDGEWIEIFNAGETAVDLSAYKLGDEELLGGAEGMFQFPAGAAIPAGGVVVIANRADTFYSLHQALPDYELHESHAFIPNMVEYAAWSGGNVELSNGGDEVLLQDVYDEQVDGLSWGGSRAVFDPPLLAVKEGHSYERKPANQDSNSAADWIDQEAPTPGEVYFLQPTATPTSMGSPTPDGPLGLLISEVLYDPIGDDPDGEWLEIYNLTGSTISLGGLRIGDEETQGEGEGMLLFPPGWQIAPGQAIVIANQAAVFSDTFGVLPDFEISDSLLLVPEMLRDTDWGKGTINLGNSEDEVLLLDWSGAPADAVSWGGSSFALDPPAAAVPEGHSLERYPPGTDTDMAVDWRDQSLPAPGEVDLTPPTPTPTSTPTPTAAAGIVINEIHADPQPTLGDANGDGSVSTTQDEFIEIVNNTGTALDLSGWGLADGTGTRHTFPIGSMVADQCAILVFGGGVPSGSFGGSVVQTASSGGLGLNNDGDRVTLLDGNGAEVAAYGYGTEGGDDQSLTRSPDIGGPEPLVKHSLAPGSGGALFSAGARLDGSSFPGCAAFDP